LARAWTIRLARFAKARRRIDGTRITLDGPSLASCGSSAQVLGIVVPELATNALKFGPFSNSDGFFAGIAIDVANAGFSRREPEREPC
jgi:two-component sensor histidine kinase